MRDLAARGLKEPISLSRFTGWEEGFIPALRWCYDSPVAKKWTNRNLPGALHYVTGNCHMRAKTFQDTQYCLTFLQAIQELRESWPFKLIAYVLMPDHCHLIVNPRDGRITDLTGAMKGLSARRMIDASPPDTSCWRTQGPTARLIKCGKKASKHFPYGVIG